MAGRAAFYSQDNGIKATKMQRAKLSKHIKYLNLGCVAENLHNSCGGAKGRAMVGQVHLQTLMKRYWHNKAKK